MIKYLIVIIPVVMFFSCINSGSEIGNPLEIKDTAVIDTTRRTGK